MAMLITKTIIAETSLRVPLGENMFTNVATTKIKGHNKLIISIILKSFHEFKYSSRVSPKDSSNL